MKQFFYFIGPAVLIEILVFKISVSIAIEKAERVNFRMIKVKIDTDEQNREMFSTDDEDYSPVNKVQAEDSQDDSQNND